MTEWISVKDRLPAYEVDVLVIDKLKDQDVACLEKRWTDAPAGWWVDLIGCGRFYPTHWMPLPEPPNE